VGKGTKEESCRERLELLKDYLKGPDQNAGRNTDNKGHSGEI
jgi:hypothetical protein